MRDAGCVESAPCPRADQSDDHRNDTGAELDDPLHVIYWQEIQSREHRQMAVEFSVGSQRYLETTDELGCCTQRVALRDVGWDRKSRTTNLIDESEVLAQWRFKSEQVRLVGELLRGAPGIEALELSHGVKRTRSRCGSRHQRSSPRCAFTHPASRIPHLASRS